MTEFSIDADKLTFEHHPPADPRAGVTFVLFNALTQSYPAWAPVADELHRAGHGTLRFDMRGQPASSAEAGLLLDCDRIVSDACALLAQVAPTRPVFVGLSIGGLFATRTWLACTADADANADANADGNGAAVEGIVLVNTLRVPGPRLTWINRAVVRAAELGGGDLVRDLFMPLLAGPQMIETLWPQCFADGGYTALDQTSPLYRLMRDCEHADWNVPWQQVDVPTLVVTGHCDNVFRIPADVDRLAKLLPKGQRLDFDQFGHMLPLECPAQFANALSDFAATL